MIRILCSIIFLFSCESSKEKYQPIPIRNFDEIVSKIIPSTNFDCWEYRNFDCFEKTTEVIFSSSKCDSIEIQLFRPNIEKGFIESCHPLLCYDYIVTQINGELDLIDDKHEAFNFIGRIDNLEEALLYIYIYESDYYYSNDDKNIQTGGYKITPNSIYLLLLKDEWSNDSILIGQYSIAINRETQKVQIERVKTFYERKI